MIKHRKIVGISSLIISVVLVVATRLTRYEFTSIEEIKLGTIFLYEGVALTVSILVILTMVSKFRFYKGWNKFFVVLISCIMIIGIHVQSAAILFNDINIAEEAREDFIFSIIRWSNFIGSTFFLGGSSLIIFLYPDKKLEDIKKIEEV